MTEGKFRLSPHSAKCAASVNPPDFVFVVGESEYECCRFQACCLSQRVCRMLKMDSTMSRLCLDIVDQEKQFSSVFNLVNGGEINITDENMEFVSQCACELENEELLSRVSNLKLEKEEISMTNVVWRIRTKQKYHMDYRSEFEFLASNFGDVTLELLTELSLDEIEDILTEKKLKLKSEDSLYELILSLANEKGMDYMLLLRHVHLMFLSRTNLDNFLDRIYPDLLDARMWMCIRQLLRKFNNNEMKGSLFHENRYHIERFTAPKFYGSCENWLSLTGDVFEHLRKKCGGNPHLKGIITASSKNLNDPECHCLIDGNPAVWESYESSSQYTTYIQFDFKQINVRLSCCYVRICDRDRQPIDLRLEGSENGEKWYRLARSDLRKNLSSIFCIDIPETENTGKVFYRYIRLTQAGTNKSGSYEFVLGGIKFYGKLIG